MNLRAEDLAALVTWWRQGSPEGIERRHIRRIKAARYAAVTEAGLVLSLAGTRRAAMLARVGIGPEPELTAPSPDTFAPASPRAGQ